MRPNIRGPLVPCGEITVAAAGTAIPLSQNWNPNYSSQTPTTPGGQVPEFAISFEDIIINSPPLNTGGLYVVSYNEAAGTGSKNSVDTILLYIPKGSIPISLKRFLSGAMFNPNKLAIDADVDGDKAWPVGII